MRQVAGVYDWPVDIGYDRQPFASLAAGGNAWTAGPAGLTVACFGWADPTNGQVSNAYSAGALLGWVLPLYNLWNWQRAYRLPPNANLLPAPVLSRITGYTPPPAVPALSYPVYVLRPGSQCVLAAVGDFDATFALGACALDQVYADPNTGAALSGNSSNPDAIPCPWRVMRSGGCGARLRISSFATLIN